MGDDSYPLLEAIRCELLAVQQRLEAQEPPRGRSGPASERAASVPVLAGAADAPPVVAARPRAAVDREVPVTMVVEAPGDAAGS
jgi:hypothetical protein